MAADKSLFEEGQPPDNGVMSRTKPHDVTLAQWLAVLAVWGLVAYGAFAGRPADPATERVHLIACR